MGIEVNNFIQLEYLDDVGVCDELIDIFQKHPFKTPGEVGGGYAPERKKSNDISIGSNNWNHPVIQRYFESLGKLSDQYVKTYEFANYMSPWTIVEGINIQHYGPGDGFYMWHAERSTAKEPFSNRHLVFMTYLNDVTDGGETEWFYQNLKVEPRKGLTAIWPADWTHTHRGCPSPTQNKYIVTGWWSFYNP